MASDLVHPDDLLLQAARSNNLNIVSDLLKEKTRGKIELDINCKVGSIFWCILGKGYMTSLLSFNF